MSFSLFQGDVIPFGLAIGQPTFMRLMTIVYSKILCTICIAYVNDKIVFGCNSFKMAKVATLPHLNRLNKQS